MPGAGPPVTLPGTYKPGDPLTAVDLNLIVKAIVRRFGGGPGLDVREIGGQIIFNLVGSQIIQPVGQNMQVQSDQGDYLICRTKDVNDIVGPEDIFVQKPWILRRSPFENLTVNGVSYGAYVSNGERVANGSETQIITQDYFSGAEITIIETDVSMLISPGVFTSVIDTNDSGRKWCEP